MKIEKMNDHQIRCILTREDLAMRQINLSELAYGSDKAKKLFQDMMQQAANDFGFEAEDIPLMIEAIPLSQEKIVLIITKVESPDELDTRFSNFTHMEDEGDSDYLAGEEDDGEDVEMVDMTSDLLELFGKLKAEHPECGHTVQEKEQEDTESDIVRVFRFHDLEEAICASQALGDFYAGENTLYKDERENVYHLFLHQSRHTVSEFNRINNVVSAYLSPQKYTPGMQAYCEEHLKVILAEHALQSLAAI